MQLHRFFLFLWVVAILGCGSNSTVDKPGVNDHEANTQFDSFKNEFPIVELPVRIKGCQTEYLSSTKEISEDKYPHYINSKEGIFGTFKTNGNYIALLTLGEADCFSPILTTYDNEGNKIDEEILMFGDGSDLGFISEEFMVIRPDFSIFYSDTVISFQPDSLGNQVPGTYMHYVKYKTGKLLPTGRIEMAGERTDTLIN